MTSSRAFRHGAVLLVLAAALVVTRRLAARSNTQVHRINQSQPRKTGAVL